MPLGSHWHCRLLGICLLALWAFVPAPAPRFRVFLAGDSTMADKPPGDAPETGWGMAIGAYFDLDSVQFRNFAVNGRSTKSFRSLGHWAAMMAEVKKGDYVFLQFGHNDAKKEDSTRYAAADTDYRNNLIRYIQEIEQRGAIPVLLSPVVRRKFGTDGKLEDTHADYPKVLAEIVHVYQVLYIDLLGKSSRLLAQLGPERSKDLYMHFGGGLYPKFPNGKADDTHFSPFGAARMAALVAEGVRELRLPLGKFLKKSSFSQKYAYELPQICVPVFKKDTVDIRQFGAKAGGIFLNTNAINQALLACSSQGGGVVLVPSGLWLTGPIRLRNHVNLHLAQGALVQFTDDFEAYPLLQTNWEGVDAIRNHAPLYGADLENVAITGPGIFDGAGAAWRPLKRSKVTSAEWEKQIASGGVLNETSDIWYPNAGALEGARRTRPGVVAEGYDTLSARPIKAFLRPNMVSLVRCRKVLIDGPVFQNAPAWTLHPLLCEHVTLRHVTVKNPTYAQNGDGVDVESTRFFQIEHCIFDTGDDGICLKSGRDAEGRRRGVPTADGIVRNCTVYKAHGGFVIGSEMSGGVRDIFVSGCTFIGTDIGLRFKTTRGRGGTVENIFASGINMTDIQAEAILFDMYYNGKEAAEALKNPALEKKPITESTPLFRHFFLSDLACRGAKNALFIQGLPEMNVQDVHLEAAVFQTAQGISCVEGDGIYLKNIQLNTMLDTTAVKVMNSRNVLLEGVQVGGRAARLLEQLGSENGAVRIKE